MVCQPSTSSNCMLSVFHPSSPLQRTRYFAKLFAEQPGLRVALAYQIIDIHSHPTMSLEFDCVQVICHSQQLLLLPKCLRGTSSCVEDCIMHLLNEGIHGLLAGTLPSTPGSTANISEACIAFYSFHFPEQERLNCLHCCSFRCTSPIARAQDILRI